ncbi:MAG: hypothetical protein NVS3B12_23970 [Acidimicrobiales bacterium]
MHRSLHTSAIVTCITWVAAYLVGSVPFGYLLSRSTMRRDLRRLGSLDLRALLTGAPGGGPDALPSRTDVLGASLDTLKVLAITLLALVAVRAASPGFHRGELPPASDVGFLTSQILTFWQSASVWAGLAAAVGHLFPVWLGSRGPGQGLAPLLALAVRCTPIGFVVAVTAFVVTRASGGDERRGVTAGLIGFVAWSWAAWLADLGHWWGFLPGPEMAIWSVVLAGIVASRALRPANP